MSPILRIVLASDGSPGALEAADFLVANFPPERVAVTVVTVQQTPLLLGNEAYMMNPEMARELLEAARQAAQGALERTLARLTGLPTVTGSVLSGPSVLTALLQYIEEHKPDLIVLGRRGHSLVGSLLLGSVSLGVVTHAHVPVLVVPPPAART